MSARPPASSPCTGVCRLDAPSGLCLGCGRTGPEIGAWGAMREAARLAVMAALPARLAAAGLPPAAARRAVARARQR